MNDITLSILTSIPEQEVYQLIVQITPSLSYETFQRQLKDMQTQGYFIIAATQGDTIVGLSGIWIATKFYCGKYLELDNLVVDEAHRGKGIGSMLIDYAISLAQEKGCMSVTLNGTVENKIAHILYDKHNFERFGLHRLLWI